METAKVSSKYQVVIPRKIREFLKIEKNSVVVFEIKKGEVVLRNLEELLEEHIGTVKLEEDFLKMRKRFNEEMIE
ncbi:MAG: AbrB/MazE/SpoVT family DNA-binding domain-containing protein [Theionarchaea archaeon]|nr:AbrB/MazE/SpoVT family DNA-binding domain-containing protein [Theionarchaea archaeon]